MGNELQVKNNNFSNISNDYLETVKNTYCRGLTNDEMMLFLSVCQRTGLDPTLKQVYPVKRMDRKIGREVMTIQTGIDGYRLIAESTSKYAPGKEYTYVTDDKNKLVSATAYVKKMTEDGTWHETSATAFYSEYVQLKSDGKPTQFWEKMPRNQLGKCAEALALRKAFPKSYASVYTAEEMEQAYIPEKECSKIEPKQTANITQQQAEELNINFSLSSPEFKSKVMDWLKIQDEKDFVPAMKSKPSVQYEVFLSRMKDAANAYQMSLTDKPEAEVQREAA